MSVLATGLWQSALSEKSSIRSHFAILCNVFIHHKAEEAVKKKEGKEEQGSDRRRSKTSADLTVVSSQKLPFDQNKNIKNTMYMHVHTHTHAAHQMAPFKALKKFPLGSRGTFQFSKNTGGISRSWISRTRKSNRNCYRMMDALECMHMHNL